MTWLLLLLFFDDSTLPDMAEIFLNNHKSELAGILPGDVRIQTNLRPVLFDHGNLSKAQVLMAFEKLQDRYIVREASVANSHGDTNYAWLEVFLDVLLEKRDSGQEYRVTFAFHYKIIGARIAISHWVLQDIH